MNGVTSFLRRRWLAAGVGLGVLLTAGVVSAAQVPIDGTILDAGGTTTWDPYYDTYACTPPAGEHSPFMPFLYGGTATKSYPFSGGLATFLGGINGDPFYDDDGQGNQSGRSLSVGPTRIGKVVVSAEETALETPSLRTVIQFHNTSSQTIRKTLAVETKTGYEPKIDASSSGDKIWTRSDRWIVTSNHDDSSYAPSTQVFSGPGAISQVRSVSHTGGDKACFVADYSLKIKPKKTIAYMFFDEANNHSAANAIDQAKKFDKSHLGSKLLGGLSNDLKKRIVNWDL